MKRLSNWDTYVREAMKDGDRSIELPLTEDECYVVGYPTRRQGREIAKAQRDGDTDALLVAMLGDEAGTRVKELAEDWPAFVLDEFLLDVMRKFGMIPDDKDPRQDDEEDESDNQGEPDEADEAASAKKPVNLGARRNGKTSVNGGKAPARRKSATASRR